MKDDDAPEQHGGIPSITSPRPRTEMPDFDLPSLSLGQDSDLDDDPGLTPCWVPEGAADQLAEDSGLEDNDDAPSLFRRLRRGVVGPSLETKARITISSSLEAGSGDVTMMMTLRNSLLRRIHVEVGN
ncbi:hypothetical protein MLD38_000539 [Melastoma candidum]|uniref:Uncharacterized protein n=1 Tax=Melastoma candidum TaxID=119954 RepID=A0ACB9S9R5_9MYRT|nr:hypothetical protein MLD38_000539 [Melastoma candidum]